MNKTLQRKFMKNLYKMDLLEDLRKLLLNFNFAIIHKTHKILVLFKNHLNYLKHNIFE